MASTFSYIKNSQTWLRRYSKFTAFSTLGLIFAGGLVTSTGSGLAVPDWPNTYGEFIFTFPYSKWVGGIFYEHLHRLLASFVGFLTLVLSIWLWRTEPRPWMKKLGLFALGAVIAQGILGGLTVLFLLPTAISMTHGILAQTFFCITIFIAYSLSKEWNSSRSSLARVENESFVWWSITLTGLIYAQLILGALMRHTGSGLAVLDFPFANGKVIPILSDLLLLNINYARFDLGLEPVTMGQIIVHMLHRLGAVLVLVTAAGLTVQTIRHQRGEDKIFLPVLFFDLLLLTQIALAAFVIWSIKAPIITTFHVWTGALLLGTSFFLTLRSLRVLIPEGRLQLIFQRQPLTVEKSNGLKGYLLSLWEMMKPRIVSLVLVSTVIGYYLGAVESGKSILTEPWMLIHTLIGTAFVAGGAGVLNHYLERDLDRQMKRTMKRPIPSGRVKPNAARRFGIYISVMGIIYLFSVVNTPTAAVAFLTLFLYLIVYTPLKMKTTWNTLIGAIPGALPTLGGWLAASGSLETGGWILFGILFLWQIPHFFAIAWLYRHDYGRVGFKMLPAVDPSMRKTSAFSVLFCVLLILCTTLLHLNGSAGKVFMWGSLLLGFTFLALAIDASRGWTEVRARRLLKGSIIYLPFLLVIMVIDQSLL
ncbi:MAG TPA: protoheme IX farnesyltransferase [Candidatus Marinimicrobia bacterium]|nr:protoheme IX farnesyltransferase [Candidatus Neomarinimicrobiota bacterium]